MTREEQIDRLYVIYRVMWPTHDMLHAKLRLQSWSETDLDFWSRLEDWNIASLCHLRTMLSSKNELIEEILHWDARFDWQFLDTLSIEDLQGAAQGCAVCFEDGEELDFSPVEHVEPIEQISNVEKV